MKIRVAVARVFGTNDQYGEEPRTGPPEAPLVLQDFPAAGESVRADFGPIPADLVDAERMRRAIGRTMLRMTFGGEDAGRLPRDVIDDAYADIEPGELFGNHNWYLSLVLEREMDLDEPEPPFDFAFTSSFAELEHEAPGYAAPTLDKLVAIFSTIVDPGVFEHLVLDDRILLFADGKRPAGVPSMRFSAGSLSVKRGGNALEHLGERIRAIRSVAVDDLNVDWLSRVAFWRVQALWERDQWRRFQWAFIALEILTHQLFAALDSREDDNTSLGNEDERDAKTLRERFEVVASELFPARSET